MSGIAAFWLALGFRAIDGDHYQYLLHGMARSGLYPSHDWMVQTASHNHAFDFLVAQMPTTSWILVLFAALYSFTAGGFGLLIRDMFRDLSVLEHFMATAVFVYLGQQVPLGWGQYPLFLPSALPSLMGVPWAALGLIKILRGEVKSAGVLGGAVFVFHFALGVLFTATTVAAVLLSRRELLRRRDFWIGVLVWAGIGGCVALPLLSSHASSVGVDSGWMTQVLIYVRLPHMNPWTEPWSVHLSMAALGVLALISMKAPLWSSQTECGAQSKFFVATWILMAFALVLVGTLAIRIPELLFLTRPFVYRILTLVQTLVGLAGVGLFVTFAIPRLRQFRWGVALGAFALSVANWGGARWDFRWLPEADEDQAVAGWLQQTTSSSEKILIPPQVQFVRTGALRSVYVDIKCAPTGLRDFSEWLNRLGDISGYRPQSVEELRSGAAKIIEGFRMRPLNALLQVATEKSLQHILVPTGTRAAADLQTGELASRWRRTAWPSEDNPRYYLVSRRMDSQSSE